MKKRYPLAVITLIIVLAFGCANNQNKIEIPKDAAKIVVEFSWEGIAACTHDSPEIRVTNIPDGTEVLDVKLTNLGVPEWNQGGGQVKYDGSEFIPAGALKIGYNGPCPPPGQTYKYEFSVVAMDAENSVIGFGKARQPFPPKGRGTK
jgi:phosphatidylethanolamine-binding protein (PEBP) family uncharacterized protein